MRRSTPAQAAQRCCRSLLSHVVTLSAIAATAAMAQTQPVTPTITSHTTLVLVPAVVRSASGDLLFGLHTQDFLLLDNGRPQIIHQDDSDLHPVARQPIAVVILLQTGASAPRHFSDYPGVLTMVNSLVSTAPHQVALVTFDSQSEEQWDFTSDLSSLSDAFTHPTPGDDQAAILDAVTYGITLLASQPSGTRRILLLLSQDKDAGSTAKLEDVLRQLGQANIAVESLAFSPEKTWLHDQFTQPRHEDKPYQFSPVIPPLLHTFNLGTPLGMAVSALRTKTSAELAVLSGGTSLPFSDRRSLDRQLATLANDLANQYVLTFRPSSGEPGFHTLELTTPTQPTATVSARTSYWTPATPTR